MVFLYIKKNIEYLVSLNMQILTFLFISEEQNIYLEESQKDKISEPRMGLFKDATSMSSLL